MDAVWAGRCAGRRAPEVGCRQVPRRQSHGPHALLLGSLQEAPLPAGGSVLRNLFHGLALPQCWWKCVSPWCRAAGAQMPRAACRAWAPHRGPRSTALGSWHWGRVLPPSENLYLGKGASSYLAFLGNQFEMKSGANVKPVLTFYHGLCWLKGMASSGVQLDILESTNEWPLAVNTRGVWVTCLT